MLCRPCMLWSCAGPACLTCFRRRRPTHPPAHRTTPAATGPLPLQMSNDVRILLPAMVAIMLAKFVADAATHSLYHGLLEVKCVPFLPKDVSGGAGHGTARHGTARHCRRTA